VEMEGSALADARDRRALRARVHWALSPVDPGEQALLASSGLADARDRRAIFYTSVKTPAKTV